MKDILSDSLQQEKLISHFVLIDYLIQHSFLSFTVYNNV